MIAMSKFVALLRLNLKSMISSYRLGGRKRTRAASGIGALVLMAGLACYLSATYSFLFAHQLSGVGMLPILMLLMPAMAMFMGFFFTVFAAQGVIFGGKDNDLMLALPVSPFLLMLTRTLALYLENLIFSLFIMLPAGAAYLFFGGAGGVWFTAALLLGTIFLALLPTLLSLACGFALAWFSSKFTRRAWVSTLLYFIFFGLLMAGVLRINTGMMELAGAADTIQEGFAVWGLPFLLLQQAACYGSPLSLIGFLAICLLPFLGVVWLFARQYKRIVTNLSAKGARSDYRLEKLSASAQWRSLLKKEADRYFGTPIYIFNTGFGLVLMLIASVAALVLRRQLVVLVTALGGLPVMPILAAGLMLLVSTVAVTGSSISLEGKYLWILKEAPISPVTLFVVKTGFQLLLCLPCLLFASVCLGLAFSVPFTQVALLVLTVGIYAVLSALLGLYLNLCYPKLDAPNDAVVVKQSAAAMLSTFGAMLIAAAGIGVYILIWRKLGAIGAVGLCAVFFAAVSAALAGLLWTKGQRMFREL